jgi:hypothetical protein
MNGDGKNCAGLILPNRKLSALDMLPPHSDDIATPLPRIEQERESQPFTRARRPVFLELSDVIFAEGSETGCLADLNANSSGGIDGAKTRR